MPSAGGASERDVLKAVRQAGGRVDKAAQMLGLSSSAMRSAASQNGNVRGAIMAGKMQRQELKKEAVKDALTRHDGLVSEAADELGIPLVTLVNWIEGSEELWAHYAACGRRKEEAIERIILASALDAESARGAKDSFPWVQLWLNTFLNQRKALPPAMAKILRKHRKGKLTARDVFLAFALAGEQLPESVRQMLSGDEEQAADQSYDIMSDEEVQRLAAERRQGVEGQKERFLPARRQEVADLKEQMSKADSFGEGAVPRDPEEPEASPEGKE